MAVKGAKKLGKWTYEYRGFKFSYTANAKSAFKASVNVFVDGQYNRKQFTTLTNAVAFIDNAFNNGATISTGINGLIITTKVGA